MRLKKLNLILSFLIFLNTNIKAQNTVGIIQNSVNSFNGYTLFTSSKITYLINNCGEVINSWTSNYPPGNSVYLLENGNLLRACKIDNPDIDFGGTGGRIELYNWDGNLIWEYNYSSPLYRQHHDVYPMPNGNILMLAVTIMDYQESVQAGRDPSKLVQGQLYNEQILELVPMGFNNAQIVWEWNIKDHLVQDFDNTKDNYGVVEDNLQLLDINYISDFGAISNWLHMNSMQYNSDLDQIIVSTRSLNELYIIDHSTTTEEAASHSGGKYGKGGDILYRWGNPMVYKRGTINDQRLFGQHFPHWIPNGIKDEGKILLFNNGLNRVPQYSEVNIVSPPQDSPGFYTQPLTGEIYEPINAEYSFIDNVNPTDFFSIILSSAQRLPNDNILICEGNSGHFFEIDSNENIVWEYINPSSLNNSILSQGDDPESIINSTFRAIRYAPDYAAFNGRNLIPSDPIELNPDTSQCQVLNIKEFKTVDIVIYPNPFGDFITIKSSDEINQIKLFDMNSRLIYSCVNCENLIDMNEINSGVYLLKIFFENQILNQRIIKT